MTDETMETLTASEFKVVEQPTASSPQVELPKVAPFDINISGTTPHPQQRQETAPFTVNLPNTDPHPNQKPRVEATLEDFNNSIQAGIVPEYASASSKQKMKDLIDEAHPGQPTQREEIMNVTVGVLGGKVDTDTPVPPEIAKEPRRVSETIGAKVLLGPVVREPGPAITAEQKLKQRLEDKAYHLAHGGRTRIKPRS